MPLDNLELDVKEFINNLVAIAEARLPTAKQIIGQILRAKYSNALELIIVFLYTLKILARISRKETRF